MAFTIVWNEALPDGDVMRVSDTDDEDRAMKTSFRERMEGDPAVPNLTGLLEVGSWALAPKPRKGTARIYVDTAANIAAFGATVREDGRLAITTDVVAGPKVWHVATAGNTQIGYVDLGGTQSMVGTLTIAAAGPQLTGLTQKGAVIGIVATVAATTAVRGVDVQVTTATGMNVTQAVSVYVTTPARTGTGTITEAIGLYITDVSVAGVTTAWSARIDGQVLFRQGAVGYVADFRGTGAGDVVLKFSLNDGVVQVGTIKGNINGLRIDGLGGAGTNVVLIGDGANTKVWVSKAGDVAIGSAALATNTTGGFVWIPDMAGLATGVPVNPTTGGYVPMVFDTTNLRLRVYTGGAWKSVLFA